MKTCISMLTALLLIGLVVDARAQPATASISGNVSGVGPDGQPFRIPGVTLQLTGASAGDAATLFSNEVGEYSFNDLAPGPYTIEAGLQGFQIFTQTIALQPGQSIIVNIRLELAVHEEIAVTSDAVDGLRERQTAPPAVSRTPSKHSSLRRSPKSRSDIGRSRSISICHNVEATDRSVDVDALALQFLSPREGQDLAAEPLSRRRVRFIELWSLKEAYVKATGLGLSRPLHSFTFQFPSEGSLRFDDHDARGGPGWQFTLFALGDDDAYRLAVAVRPQAAASDQRIRVHDPSGTTARPARLIRVSLPASNA